MTKAQAIKVLEQDGLVAEAEALRVAKQTKKCNICKCMIVPAGQHACDLCD